MKKAVTKYMYILAFGGTIIIFVLFILTDYLVVLLAPGFALRTLLFFVSALTASFLITMAMTIFDPVLIEAIFLSRKIQKLDSLSNPLILKLSAKAPGTYHHSLNVSNLAQKAAKNIGADSLLVRAAAYYHDIGKISHPELFIENKSRHETPPATDPDLLHKHAQEIISHVEEGIKIAKNYNLPEEIIDLIAEHHGTSQALYFYERAKETGLKIKQSDFRYPGPKPLSKESGILMLADVVEAAVRSFPNPSADNIRAIIHTTVQDRIKDNQLKHTGLSTDETEKIKRSFEETFASIYHQRIEYKKDDSGNSRTRRSSKRVR